MNRSTALPFVAGLSPRFNRWIRALLLFVSLLALGTIGFFVWDHILKPRFVLRNWGIVVPGQIYRSGQVSHFLIEDTIKKYRLGTIISMSGDRKDQLDVAAEREASQRLGVVHMNCPLPGDGRGDIRQYAKAIAAMVGSVKQGKPVLVHCHTGAQRTGGVIAFYRALVQRKSGREIYHEMLAFNHDPAENSGLIGYLNESMPQMAKLLLDNGTIENIPDPLPVIAP